MKSAGFNRHSSLNPADFYNRRWRELLDIYLPVREKDSIWRYSRLRESADPQQGWKLHVSATILNAVEILEIVAPFLKDCNVFYKVPISLEELKKLNAGIFYGYPQIGKFITIYPQNDEQSIRFAERLDRLTGKFTSPPVPFDFRFKPKSSVYYRYGAFQLIELVTAEGDIKAAIRNEEGDLIPDLRDCAGFCPAWLTNSFPVEQKMAEDSPLKKNFRVFRALAQRGKGGVYQGLDLSSAPPRPCLLKEGRGGGEVEWDGRDGFWRVRHEAAVLRDLRAAEINVPQIYGSFETANNFYLATEFIEGVNLHVYLKKRKRRLKISRAIDFAVQLTDIISRLHAAGWLWRDCKPANLIVDRKGILRPIDFEGACLVAEPDGVSWNTLTYKSADRRADFHHQTSESVDLYALGAIIYLLLEGELPPPDESEVRKFSRKKISRKNIPAEMKMIVLKLLNPKGTNRLKAAEAGRKLKILRRK